MFGKGVDAYLLSVGSYLTELFLNAYVFSSNTDLTELFLNAHVFSPNIDLTKLSMKIGGSHCNKTYSPPTPKLYLVDIYT